MIDSIKSLFFPGPYDYDFRPLFMVVTMMISSIAYAIKHDWEDIQDEFNDDWEQK
jgi:hypothetical protein